jgi:hypothetical protein
MVLVGVIVMVRVSVLLGVEVVVEVCITVTVLLGVKVMVAVSLAVTVAVLLGVKTIVAVLVKVEVAIKVLVLEGVWKFKGLEGLMLRDVLQAQGMSPAKAKPKTMHKPKLVFVFILNLPIILIHML